MSTGVIPAQNNLFKLGWSILLVAAALMALMHFGLTFILKDPVLFTGFAVFNLYAFMVVLIPFRRGEIWAWVATWLLPIGLAVPAFLAQDSQLVFYYGVAAVCVLGLLFTMRDFFSKSRSILTA